MARGCVRQPGKKNRITRVVKGKWLLTFRLLVFVFAVAATESFRESGPVFLQQVAGKPGEEIKLQLGQAVTGRVAQTSDDRFSIDMIAGQFAQITIQKEGDLALMVTLVGPDDKKSIEAASRRYGSLRIPLVAEVSGSFHLSVRSLENTGNKHYDVRVEGQRALSRDDRVDDSATRAFFEAERMRADWTEAGLKGAIEKYSQAITLWEPIGHGDDVQDALENIGEVYSSLSQYHQALVYFNKALAFSQANRNRSAEICALTNIGYAHANTGNNPTALQFLNRALALIKSPKTSPSQHDRNRQARALNNMGEVYYSSGDLKHALVLFKDAVGFWKTAGNRGGEALAHLNIGYTYFDMGDAESALLEYQECLSLSQTIDERRIEALARTALGGVYSRTGKRQLALAEHQRAALVLSAIGDPQGEAAALNGIGRFYEEFNQPEVALDNYEKARKLYQQAGNREFEALGEYYIGRVYRVMSKREEAFAHYQKAIELSRAVNSRRIEAYALKDMGSIYDDEGKTQKALVQYDHVLKLYRQFGDRRGQAQTLNSLGVMTLSSGNAARAIAYHNQALLLNQTGADLAGEAASRLNIARAERAENQLSDSLSEIKKALAILETLRSQIANYDLRSSYFALMREYYDFYINLLMRLHKQDPAANFARMALEASENARARSLLEMLIEADVDIRKGVPADILSKEQALRQQLSAKAKYHVQLMNNKRTEGEAAALALELRDLTTQYQELETQIRQQSSVYSSLTQPHVLSVTEIQDNLLLDDKTVLLEYSLGSEASYLWVISRTSMESFELPPRSRIEEAAQSVYRLICARQPAPGEATADYRKRIDEADKEYWTQAAVLSEMLLGPVVGELANKRLLIVPDGALQYVPFEALPIATARTAGAQPGTESPVTPSGEPPQIMLKWEIATLPSATTLLSLRTSKPAAARGDRVAAVFADPVFGVDDPRVKVSKAATSPTNTSSGARDGQNQRTLPRLPGTLLEGESIISVIPHSAGILATGFEANRSRLASDESRTYQILHFATHGVVDSQHPELSGIVLSLVNRKGEPDAGFLQLHDICDLKLNSQLVVLSACDSGLGHDIRGEGLVGLTRGFLYAGSKSTIASLWKVDDDATAELMSHFYEALISRGMTPGAALRTAKEAMRKQPRWHQPYYWAGFILQGEYNGRIIADRARLGTPAKVGISITALIILLAALVGIRRRTSRSAP
jgi:CHAT domain-containing protein